MNCCDWSRCFLTLLLLSPYRTPPLRHPAAVQASNRERFPNAVVQYDWVSNSRGERLRTFITRPRGTSGKVAVIFFVGWLSCDSMEYPNGAGNDGFGALMLRLIDESGYATVRMNKPGVAESEGNCAKATFKDELEGWQAAFDSMSQYDFIDLDRVFIFGLSNGGGFSPLVARNRPVRGYLSASSWGRHPEWLGLWYDSPDGQYGRPAAFYQQLQSLNLGEIWQGVNAPTLVLHGAADTIMSRADSEAIAQIVNQVHPGQARYAEIEGMGHDLTVNGKFHEPLVATVMDWMRQRLADR